jgi:hypothetical protein
VRWMSGWQTAGAEPTNGPSQSIPLSCMSGNGDAICATTRPLHPNGRQSGRPMSEPSEQMLRGYFSGWPRRTPVELLQQLRELDRKLAPLVRSEIGWSEVPAVLMTGIESALTSFPDYQRQLWAHALDWMANAHDYAGDRALAICCLEARLRMRTPRNPFRSAQYVTLVTLLEAVGNRSAARSYAMRGARYCHGRTGDAEATLLRKFSELAK